MRCLLDKVTARHILEGMLKLVEEREVTSAELFALYFYRKTIFSGLELFIVPQTHNMLERLKHFTRYTVLIRGFLAATQVSYPARYFKGWQDICKNMASQKKIRKSLHFTHLEQDRTEIFWECMW